MTKIFCFSVDLDRDVNICLDGDVRAGSIDRGAGTAPRFKSTEKGLNIIVDLLEEIGMKATFFAEGRTLETIECGNFLAGHEVGIHGYDHEDLTRGNGMYFDKTSVFDILKKTSDIIEDTVGTRPVSFRAPYMKINESVIDVLPSAGIKYDSSTYCSFKNAFPYELFNGTVEIPVPEGIDGNGKKISSYLWPMHESKRKPEDYLESASSMKSGILSLATHTWHMCESRANGPMDDCEIRNNTDNVRRVLEGILDLGFSPRIVSEAVHSARLMCQP
jgi:hypothetical protein